MIIAYTGLPGSGKSLSAVSDYVLPQLRKERHVFCNISGLDPMRIAARLEVTTSEVNRCLHRFAMAFDDGLARDRGDHWAVRPDGSRYYANSEGLLRLLEEVMSKKEAVLILDECHEYLCPENWKLLRPFLKYLSMARHYGHDIVLVTQHVSDIWEPLRNRIHETHDFTRGLLGFRSQYRETVYHGWNVHSHSNHTRQRVNDKTVYSLYSSHDGGAKEHMKYMSVWQNKKLLFYLFLIVFFFSFSAVFLWRGLAFYRGSAAPSPSPSAVRAPEHSLGSNVIYVKYVVCGAFDCKAVRPDGTVLTLPLDYASGRYPLEVRKYAPHPSNSFLGGSAQPGSRPGLPHAPR